MSLTLALLRSEATRLPRPGNPQLARGFLQEWPEGVREAIWERTHDLVIQRIPFRRDAQPGQLRLGRGPPSREQLDGDLALELAVRAVLPPGDCSRSRD